MRFHDSDEVLFHVLQALVFSLFDTNQHLLGICDRLTERAKILPEGHASREIMLAFTSNVFKQLKPPPSIPKKNLKYRVDGNVIRIGNGPAVETKKKRRR